MTEGEFRRLFTSTLEAAARDAERRLGFALPRQFRIRLYGADHAGDVVGVTTAVASLYLGADRFYRIIDVAVVEVTEQEVTCFVRASGHRPGSFAQTWNTPPGHGPFKLLTSAEIKVALPQSALAGDR